MTISDWRPARVVANEPAAEEMVSLTLAPESLVAHRAGQHYELRFPGEELSRKYSVVNGPAHLDRLEFGVQILPTGLLSPRLARTVPGDRLELRGPLGESFFWEPSYGRSLLLLGAGAGITPLLSIYEHFSATFEEGICLFHVSAKRPDRIYRYARCKPFVTTRFTATEARLGRDDLARALAAMTIGPDSPARLCGPPRFIDAMVDSLIDLGFSESGIRSETFL